MPPNLAAELERLNLPASEGDYTPADWKKHNAAIYAWLDEQNEPPADGGIEIVDLTAGSPTFGQATITTSEEIDLMKEFDQEPPGSEEAIAIAAKLEALEALRRPRPPSDHCGDRHRRATPVIRRTRIRVRSNLRSG